MSDTELVRYLDRDLEIAPRIGAEESPPGGLPRGRWSAAEQAAIDGVNERVAAAPDLAHLLDFVLENTRAVAPCDRLSVAFLDPDGERLVAHATRADYEPLRLRPGFTAEVAGSSLQHVIAAGRPRILSDLPAYAAAHPDSVSSRLLVSEGVRSSLTCPLFVDDRVVGVLFRSSRQLDAYSERHVALHQQIARRLAQAVDKAYRIEQLAAANQAYSEMLGFVSHELKGPVAGMVMESQLLHDGLWGPVSEQQQQRLQRMIRRGEHLLGIVRDYLDLARMEGGELRATLVEGVSFSAAILEPARELVGADLEERRMRYAAELGPGLEALHCDPDLLRIVLVNLLGNGVKYGREEGQLEVRAERSEGTLRVTVRNEGPGFPPEQRSRLFRKFSRLDTPALRSRRGTGVGLYTAWRIARLHGGRMDARSEPGEWAEFELIIPQPVPVEAPTQP